MRIIIGQPEAERIAIERHQPVDRLRRVDIEHDVAEAQRAGAKARDRAARLERLRCRFGAVKNLEPVAERIVEHDQILDVPLIGERAGAAGDLDPAVVQMRRQRVERGGVGGFPAEKTDALAAVGIDDEALLAVVHAEGERRARFVDALQAEQAAAIACPVAQILGAHADIAESLRSGSLRSHCRASLPSFYTDGNGGATT